MRTHFSALLLLLFCGMSLLTGGCIQHRNLLNFSEGPDLESIPAEVQQSIALTIQPDDILSIAVFSLDPDAAAPFNLREEGESNAREHRGQGYLVGKDGTIDFPVLGQIDLRGQTIAQARNQLTTLLQQYIKNPIVHIRFTNFKITVLGEVVHPATFTLPDEQVSILEALGMAGDITPYGNRRNILVIREQDGRRSFGRVNLQSRQVFESPYFYLKQNDVVYIEPRKEKTATLNDRATRILPYISIATAFATLLVALRR